MPLNHKHQWLKAMLFELLKSHWIRDNLVQHNIILHVIKHPKLIYILKITLKTGRLSTEGKWNGGQNGNLVDFRLEIIQT